MTRKQTVITFTIDVPAEGVDRLKPLLEATGVRFDPARQVVAFNDAMLDKAVAMGHHLPGMVEGLNRHLDAAGLTPRIPTDHKEWTIERRHAFLQLAIENLDWEENEVGYDWWKDEGMSWDRLAEEHPLVFKGRED